MTWGAVVAAGGLVDADLASVIGTRRKALAKVGGQTCLERTLAAVMESGVTDCATVSGEDVRHHVTFGKFVHEADRQIENARRAVEALGHVDALLFLPADSPYLDPLMLSSFMVSVQARVDPKQDRWLAAGLTSKSEFAEEFPAIKSKPIRLKDGAFLSGALYAASPAGFRHALSMIEGMSQHRKNQLAMVARLGPWTVVRFLCRRIGLAEAELTLGRLFESQAILVTGCDPRMAVDIDDAEDFRAITQESKHA